MKENQDQLIYEKVAQIVDVFAGSENMTKMHFIQKVFHSAFELIPEAEKGSYYELVGEYYQPLLSQGYDYETLMKLRFKVEDSFVDYECDTISGIQAYAKKVDERSNEQFDDEMIETFKALGTYESFHTLYAPIIVDQKSLGIICLDNFQGKPFSQFSKKILRFYAQMISNFYNMILVKEREVQANQEIVMALVSAIEVNDSYTKGHGRRVQQFSRRIAERFNLSPAEISDISTAALLHDVGKIGIPKEILNKPGKLTKAEYEIIKDHPAFTKQILENITNFSEVVSYAYCHHEYYNGQGYPRGLKGDEIPFGAKIIMISDVFDALTDDRSYRRAYKVEDAIDIIRSESGKMFDPRIVEVAIEVFLADDIKGQSVYIM